MSVPAVSVLMPVYNGAEFLREAVDSILSQTFTDFEFLIVDDGSTDATPRILKEFAGQDARIRIIRNEENQRIAVSLNRGLNEARADLIARMDADDASLPDRLAKQVAFFARNPDIHVCGGALAVNGNSRDIWAPPVENDAIRARMLFETAIYHPTVMFRTDIVRQVGGYAVDAPPVEDYDLWMRLLLTPGVRFANISDIVLHYRHNPSDEGRREQLRKQVRIADQLRCDFLEKLGALLAEAEREAFCDTVSPRALSPFRLYRSGRFLGRFADSLWTTGYTTGEALENECRSRWAKIYGTYMAANRASAAPVFYCCRFGALHELSPVQALFDMLRAFIRRSARALNKIFALCKRAV